MNRIGKGILTLALTLVFTLGVFALEGEYKNNLLKVDFVKTGEGNYAVDLFTQKPYNSAVKVIKKSDTSYYILLPETYHSITSAPAGEDIKNVEIKLYPYAGQDINNGYTKINITTAKPVNFTTGVKTASAAGTPKVDFEKLAKLDSIFAETPKTTVAPVKPAAVQPPVIEAPKAAVAAPAVKPAATVVPNVTQMPKGDQRQVVNIQMPKADIAEKAAPVKDLVKASTAQAPKTLVIDVESESARTTAPVKTTIDVIDDRHAVSMDSIPPADITPADFDDMYDEEAIASGDETAQEDLTMVGEEVLSLEDESTVDKIKSVLRPLYHFAKDNIALVLSAGVIFLLLFAVLVRRRRKPAQGVGIASQADIMQGEPIEGEIVRGPFTGAEVEEPTILTAEEFINMSPADFVHGTTQAAQAPTEPFSEVVEEMAAESAAASDEEAQVLSCVEIEPDRGFYLARFNGKVSLLGYVKDELFVIHQFKQDPQDVRIMHRLSEKSSEGTFYLVKVEDVKMLVRSTPDALSLELLM